MNASKYYDAKRRILYLVTEVTEPLQLENLFKNGFDLAKELVFSSVYEGLDFSSPANLMASVQQTGITLYIYIRVDKEGVPFLGAHPDDRGLEKCDDDVERWRIQGNRRGVWVKPVESLEQLEAFYRANPRPPFDPNLLSKLPESEYEDCRENAKTLFHLARRLGIRLCIYTPEGPDNSKSRLGVDPATIAQYQRY